MISTKEWLESDTCLKTPNILWIKQVECNDFGSEERDWKVLEGKIHFQGKRMALWSPKSDAQETTLVKKRVEIPSLSEEERKRLIVRATSEISLGKDGQLFF